MKTNILTKTRSIQYKFKRMNIFLKTIPKLKAKPSHNLKVYLSLKYKLLLQVKISSVIKIYILQTKRLSCVIYSSKISVLDKN